MKPSTLLKPESPVTSPPALNRLASTSDRWRWMALSGVAVGSAAVTPGAFAEIVQITQVDNYVSSSSSNTLRPDLTGDGKLEFDGLQGDNTQQVIKDKDNSRWEINNVARAFVERQGFYRSLGQARFFRKGTGNVAGSNQTGTGYKNWINNNASSGLKDRSVLIPLQFTDTRINSGNPTNGLLEVRTTSLSQTSHTVRLVRLVFNDTSTAQPPIGPGGVVPGDEKDEFDPNKPAIINIINNGGDVNRAQLQFDLAILKQRLKKYKVRYKKASKRNQDSPRYKLLGRNVKRLQIDIKRLELQLRKS